MSTFVGVVSTRNWDGAILEWSDLDEILHNSCANHNLPTHSFHADNGFLGTWLSIRTTHRGSALFSLNARLLKENIVMKKSRIRKKWSYGIVKTFWKLVTKCLYFKLDQNSELCQQKWRVSFLLCNDRTCYRGNSLSDVTSFSHALPTIEEHLNIV